MNERQAFERELGDLGLSQQAWPQGEGEVLPPIDDRIPVRDTSLVPFRWICHLEMSALDTRDRRTRARSVATGLLIGPCHVLTTGHTLLTGDGRFAAVQAWVSPGRNGSSTPFGRVQASRFRTNPNWFRNGVANEDYDYGLITLDDEIGARKFASLGGNPLGWWGDPARGAGTRIERLDPAGLDGQAINVAGYPSDKPAGSPWRSTGRLTMMRNAQGQVSTLARRMAHDADTHASQSGAPVWTFDAKTGIRRLVGVHTGAVDLRVDAPSGPQQRRTNVAIRLTLEVVRQLAAWR
jgi:V8-like Glu-specific endopeptidase